MFLIFYSVELELYPSIAKAGSCMMLLMQIFSYIVVETSIVSLVSDDSDSEESRSKPEARATPHTSTDSTQVNSQYNSILSHCLLLHRTCVPHNLCC